jgi:hypothetical protein
MTPLWEEFGLPEGVTPSFAAEVDRFKSAQ